jgi:hypothetical protein
MTLYAGNLAKKKEITNQSAVHPRMLINSASGAIIIKLMLAIMITTKAVIKAPQAKAL